MVLREAAPTGAGPARNRAVAGARRPPRRPSPPTWCGARHHPIADRHEVSGDDAADACATAFPYDRARQKTFSEPGLGQRRLTVYRFAGSDGSVRTVRVHGLAGVGAGAAILMDDGRSFHIDSAGPEPYLTADAEVVPREAIP